MDDRGFSLQGTRFERRGFSGERGIRFEWNLLYRCNYRCPHCCFEGRREENERRDRCLLVEEWVRRWERISRDYGRVALVVTGGEPFLYPEFTELIARVSGLHYPVNITTNGSGDLDGFTRRIDPSRVSLSLSFQPVHDTIETFLDRARLIAGAGFPPACLNFCAYPPYLGRFGEYVERTHAAGFRLKVIPFVGEFQGVRYPDGYTPQERALLGLDRTWERNVRRAGTVCRAGHTSALLLPDGKVVRCGQVGERFVIGDFFSPEFRLLDAPLACDAPLCPCLEGEPEEHS